MSQEKEAKQRLEKVRLKRTRHVDLSQTDDLHLLFYHLLLSLFLLFRSSSPSEFFLSVLFLFHSLCLLQLKQHALLWLVKRNQVRCFCEVWSPSTSYCAVNSVSRHQRGLKDTVVNRRIVVYCCLLCRW